MQTKTIKIPLSVHRELKIYSAQSEENMTELVGLAVMNELASRGHKFTMPKRKQSNKK